jgi:phosphoribosylformylglycinamidine synthase subunit PurS
LKISATVTLKKDVLDPQGKVVSQTLKNMGFESVINVRQGKYFEIDLKENDKEKAKEIVEEISKKLLTNMVIENYTIDFK